MPRRKQNVEAYGKSWSPFDIPNLEKAVKLYERLNYLQDHFAGSLSGANKIMAQINEQTEIQEELKKNGINLTEAECKKVLELFKIRQQDNAALRQSQVLSASQLASTAGKNYTGYQSGRSVLNGALNNAGSSYMNMRLQNDASSALRGAAISANKRGYTKGTAEYANYVNQYAADKMNGAADKYMKGANAIQLAADTFGKIVDVFGRLLKTGIENQKNVYEQTFTNIAVRTGMTRETYLKNELGTSNKLFSMGLGDNIKTSEVQKMWNTLANQGLSQEQVLANAIDTVLTQTIVPYLDVTSSNFQYLVDQQPQLMKQVRGIGQASLAVSDNSVFVNKYLQDMIDNLSPMAALAENELGVQYAQISGTYANLRAQGLSDAEIGEAYKGAAQVYRDPLAALRSGNLDAQLAVINGVANEIDFRDSSQVNAEYLKGLNFVSNLTPEGKWSPIYAGMTNTLASVMTKVAFNERNPDIAKALAAGNDTADILNEIANRTTNNLTSGAYQTNKSLTETYLENIMTWVATISNQIGYWSEIISSILQGIAGIFGAKILGKLGKSMFGKARRTSWS